MNVTKQEMIKELNEITAILDERAVEEITTFAAYITWRAGFPDEFVPQATPAQIYEAYGLDGPGITAKVRGVLRVK